MRHLLWPVVALTATVAFLLGLVAAGTRHASSRLDWTAAPAAASTPSAPEAAATTVPGPDFSSIVSSLQDTVVSVRAASRGTDRSGARSETGDEVFGPREESGTGFIIDAAGGILTNYHVIQGADRITVTLSDGRIFKASVTGIDDAIDVALLQIAAQDPLPVAPLGHSEALKVGEWVCAIGSPIGYANSATVGVVSYLDRKVAQWSVDGLIQTDAAMSPGSSGSPLLNTAGQVVGITAAFSKQSANIGFAIPISQVVAVLPQLRDLGRVSRGYISLGLTPVTPELRSALNLGPAHGALVADVPADRAAERAGLVPYDVILSVDGDAVASDVEVLHAVAARRPGSVVRFEIWRDGNTQVIPVRLEERPLPPSAAGLLSSTLRPAASSEQGPLGMTVRDLDAATLKGLPAGMAGVRVVDVDAAGPARLAHVRLGEVVVQLNRHPVTSAADFEGLVGALHPGDVAALLVYEPLLKEYAILSIVLDSRQ